MGIRSLVAQTSGLSLVSLLGASLGMAAPPLEGLPSALRSQILAQATPEQRCQIEVFESKLGMRFKPGPNAPLKQTAEESGACRYDTLAEAQAAGEMDVTIADATTFLSKLRAFSGTLPPRCGFKYRVSAVAEKSVDRIQANMKDQFIKTFDYRNPSYCVVPSSWSPYVTSVPGNPTCTKAAVSAAYFVECFRMGSCEAECAVGAQAAELNLLYDVYGENLSESGQIVGAERELFDDAYFPDETVVGPWKGPHSKGIQDTESAFEAENEKKKVASKYYSSQSLAKLGKQAFTGVKVYLETKDGYKNKIKSGEIQREDGIVNLGQNGMIVSVSAAAAKELQGFELSSTTTPNPAASDALVSEFEREAHEVRKLILGLSYSDSATDSCAYQTLVNHENFEAIMNGGKISVASHCVKPTGAESDEVLLQKIKAKLGRPIFREIEIYVHPLGRMKFAQLMLYMANKHPDADLSFRVYPTSMNDEQYFRYLGVQVDRCLNRKRADRK